MSGKDLLLNNIETLKENLMLGHKQSQKYPSTVIGNERELIIESLLARVLPHNIRYGSGVIMDGYGKTTGQIDIVLECEQSFSLPITSGKQRLYFADTVAAAIEVKSDLRKQKVEAFAQSHAVQQLQRKKSKEKFIFRNEYLVPSYIIAFKGPDKDTIAKWLFEECREKNQHYPTGILCLEPAYFFSFEPSGNFEASGDSAVFAFLCSLSNWLSFNRDSRFDIKSYVSLLDEAEDD
ncbi:MULTISPECIES: DUF6602 domain-containing protein [Pseudomonas]|uniref:DUF6602 domain-containing protein n=1 Tax=Pseudomonas TaxID=286 RepID=UPI0002F43EDA|nr:MULTISPECIES: DUF6602 domain-containing protein [Pseudomonas]AZD91775.1 hypothetical protein C4K13_2358 [Pseudomonas chlororaphis subsp. aureofaciens]KAB0531000.1 hypothetical protein F7R16_17415 [Pseudomonas chlororaphis subsp. aureofaciens]TSD32091.1 hypothetical protein FCE86_021820 [Pseudomonas sp. ATCC 13985]WDG50483.1 hypothetical protein PUP58_12085 [Pseudomonas chlororaphis]WDG63115.1 hypothetical protein PUP52_14575 [Pseudomonas chlororaphis]